MLKLMYICNDPEMAALAAKTGVDRIFVDLEIIGKKERQGHRDTLISSHEIEDVIKVRKSVPDCELLVRINPMYAGTKQEVEQVIVAGADLVMLPMFMSAMEVSQLVELVAGRAKVIPLVETPQAMAEFSSIVSIEGVDEIYFGLNDLHVALGMSFMFEPLANGMVEEMANIAKGAKVPFGFGGIARVGEGMLPGDMVLAEHLRLGSSMVILSRTFQRTEGSSDVSLNMSIFKKEIDRLRDEEKRLLLRDPTIIEADHVRLVDAIREISTKP